MSEGEAAVERLLDHLRNWLVTQPEWPVLMGASDRATRRRVARIIAEELTTIPARQFDSGVVNRATRRRLFRELERGDGSWWKDVYVHDVRGVAEGFGPGVSEADEDAVRDLGAGAGGPEAESGRPEGEGTPDGEAVAGPLAVTVTDVSDTLHSDD